MKAILALLLAASALNAADGPKVPETPKAVAKLTRNFAIESHDPALAALIDKDAKIEVLASGFTWSEGPVWFQGKVVFSDVPQNIAYSWQEGEKGKEIFLKPSGTSEPSSRQGSNGLAVDPKGNLLLCQHGDRCVALLTPDKKFQKLATGFEGRRFNSPNDLAVAKDGSVYFTDPPYGLGGEQPEIDFHGVYKLAPDGEVTLVTKAVQWPNGIALSLDQKTIYLAVSDPKNSRIMACDLDGGRLRDVFRVNAIKGPRGPGNCDGLKLDAQGNIWTSGPGGVLVLSPEGRHLGTLALGMPTANLAWGNDGHDLYITSSNLLLRVKTKVKGAGF